MAKHLPGHFFSNVAAYDYSEYFCTLPPDLTVADLFTPMTWAHHAKRLNKADIIRVRTEDGATDITLVVDSVSVGGVHVSPWPKFAGATGVEAGQKLAAEAAENKLSVVPLGADGYPIARIQHLPATKWRVMGLNGEIARDMETEMEAQNKLDEYLKLAGLEMPSLDKIEAAVAEAEEKAAQPPVVHKPTAAKKAAAKKVA